MKTNCITLIFLGALLLFCRHVALSQKNKGKPIDSALEANSEKWKVQLNKGFGLGKPEFGPYTTSGVGKTDSPVLKKRTKTDSHLGLTSAIYGLGWDWDFSKYETVEKAKAYRGIVAKETDTAQLLFSIYRISEEKTPTFLGELVNNNGGTTLGFKTNLSGIIATSYDTILWRFLIVDTLGRKEPNAFRTRNTYGYLMAGIDSLYAEPIMSQYAEPAIWRQGSTDGQPQIGVFVNNTKGDHLAALKFGTQGNLTDPFVVWIRKDTEPVKQHVIASFFSLMMIAKVKQQ